MSEGKKFDTEKRRMDLIPISALKALGDVLTHGSKKYGDRNWERGIQWSRFYRAILRHVLAFWEGEDLDQESGLPHLAHAMCGCAFLLEYMTTHIDMDDRPVKIEQKKMESY